MSQSEEAPSAALRPPRSEPETEIMPSAQRLLNELLILQPYQTDPNDPASLARIELLQETGSMEEEDERMRNSSQPHAVNESSTQPDDRPDDASLCELSDGFESTPRNGWRAWLDAGVPEAEHFADLFRLVLVGDFPYPITMCLDGFGFCWAGKCVCPARMWLLDCIPDCAHLRSCIYEAPLFWGPND